MVVAFKCNRTTTAQASSHFPSEGVMDALGVVYLQYWRDSGPTEKSFCKHLDVLKNYFG
jgi:hypothetical protein